MIKFRAFTLVEMLAVIAVSSVLLVIATSAIHRALRVDSQWNDEADAGRALARLSHDFRTDVHRAQEIELAEDPFTLRLACEDGVTITYEVAADEIIRDFQSEGQQRSREFYKKPESYEAQITIDATTQWVQLRVTRDPQLVGVKPRIVLHVEAEAGRLLRLARGQGDSP